MSHADDAAGLSREDSGVSSVAPGAAAAAPLSQDVAALQEQLTAAQEALAAAHRSKEHELAEKDAAIYLLEQARAEDAARVAAADGKAAAKVVEWNAEKSEGGYFKTASGAGGSPSKEDAGLAAAAAACFEPSAAVMQVHMDVVSTRLEQTTLEDLTVPRTYFKIRILSSSLDGSAYIPPEIEKRFSEFVSFRKQLLDQLGWFAKAVVKKVPFPKKGMGTPSKSKAPLVTSQRLVQLSEWLRAVLNMPDVLCSQALRDFVLVDLCEQLNLPVLKLQVAVVAVRPGAQVDQVFMRQELSMRAEKKR